MLFYSYHQYTACAKVVQAIMLNCLTMSTSKIPFIAVLIVILAATLVVYMVRSAHRGDLAGRQVGINRYLPLGDSYTIGESVAEADRWPNQLTSQLNSDGKHLQIIANPAVTGFTTQDLIDKELPLIARLKPDFVTLQIGVNDYVQGIDAATFAGHLNYILSTVQRQLSKPGNLVLVTIPDYGKTPTGAEYGSPQESEKGIRAFNAIIIAAGVHYHVPVADIFAISQNVAIDPSLIADDGLHPSAKEYAAWSTIIQATIVSSHLPAL
jgi:lysophospholipase L1-like esterase